MDIYIHSDGPDDGYLNIPEIYKYMVENNCIYCFLIGPRGTGKSYGVQKYLVEEYPDPFLYFRLAVDEVEAMLNPEYNAFNKYNMKEGKEIIFEKMPHVKELAIKDLSPGCERENIGMAVSLKRFGKLRGVSMEKFTLAFLDEFIPEKTVRKEKGQGEGLLQSYETINRNRELEGQPPLRFICVANTNNINSDILLDFNLIPIIEMMEKKDYEYYAKKRTLVVFPRHSPISKRKAEETALYNSLGAESGSYRDMAIDNKFARHYTGNVETCKLHKGFEMKFIFRNCLFLRGSDFWYVTDAANADQLKGKVLGDPEKIPYYGDSDFEIQQLKRRWYFLPDIYLNGNIKFERSDLELRFINLFKMDKT